VPGTEDVTTLLERLARGERQALDALLPIVYDELCVLARRQRYRFRGEEAPATESLVHGAYMKLADQARADWKCRAQFFYVASLAMRSLLIDQARRRGRRKRGGGVAPVPLVEDALAAPGRGEDLLALDAALDRLARSHERLARIVECRFFGGLTIEETAQATGLSPATVKRGWDEARLRLYEDLRGSGAP